MKYFVSSAQTLLLVVASLSSQCNADTHVLIVPSQTALDVTDEPQCGHMREAYAEIVSQCAPKAVDDDLTHYVDSFHPVESKLNITGTDETRRALRGSRRLAKCSDCKKNPDACCMLGIYFHCSLCMATLGYDRRRLSTSTSTLEDQFRLTS